MWRGGGQREQNALKCLLSITANIVRCPRGAWHRLAGAPAPSPGQARPRHLKMDRRLLSLPAALCLPRFQMSRLGRGADPWAGGGDKGREHGSLPPEGSFPDPAIPPSHGQSPSGPSASWDCPGSRLPVPPRPGPASGSQAMGVQELRAGRLGIPICPPGNCALGQVCAM